MNSPYESRLEGEIAAIQDDSERASKRAELAGLWARIGEFQRCEEVIAELRSLYGDGRNTRVSVMIMWAEAQLIYFKDLGVQARDRMSRAQLISVASRDASLSALTSAWLAHIDFNLHRHQEMSRALKVSLDTVSKADHLASCRLALTLGDAYFAAGDETRGRRWYSKAHEHAVKLGDHASIGALTYNRAALRVFLTRIARVKVGEDLEVDLNLLNGEIRSAANYQAVAGLSSLQDLLGNARASILILQQDFVAASKAIADLLERSPRISASDRNTNLMCDLVLCLSKSDRKSEAARRLDLLDLAAIQACTPDDQVLAYGSLEKACIELGLERRASEFRLMLADSVNALENEVRDLRTLLSMFDSDEYLNRI